MRSLSLRQKNGALSLLAKMVSVSAILFVGLLAYLSTNPEAHEFFHSDSDHADHQCVVTEFAAGEGLYLAPEIVFQPTAITVQCGHFSAREIRLELFDDLLPPVCGPPSVA